MRNFFVCIQAVVMAILLVTLAFIPLLAVKGVLVVLYWMFPKMPKDKPQWIDTMVSKLVEFYNTYLSF